MDLFDLPQARHFCTPVTQIAPGTEQSLPAFCASLPRGVTHVHEGTERFNVYRVNLLNSVERWLLYSLAHYRRAHDMFVPASAPWAHVTLYYSSFFAANALLGMFGGWIAVTRDGSRVVDVESGKPGSQGLRVHRRPRSPNGATGSHRVFWDFFYDAAATLIPWSPPALGPALQPDGGWQINTRNEVNYDMFHAWSASTLLHSTFNPQKMRKTLSGPLAQQLETTERLVRLAVYFADELTVSSLGTTGCGGTGTRAQIQRRLAKEGSTGLATQSAFPELLG